MVERLHGGDPAKIAAMTALEPIGRFGSSEEAAPAFVWRCLPESSFVAGIATPVDGGFLA